MGTTKVTFTLDDAALSCLRDAAERLSLPKSEIVREAIMEFHDRIGRLSERERVALLRAFDELVPVIPTRSATEVDREIAGIRTARRAGGRTTRLKGNL
jgi:hypothetical protein